MSLQCKARWVKQDSEDEIRRFKLDQDVAASFVYLKKKICTIFPDLHDEKIKLFWKDESEELIAFSSDEELVDALGNIPNEVFNITIKQISEKPSGDQQQRPSTGFFPGFPQGNWSWPPNPSETHHSSNPAGPGNFRPPPEFPWHSGPNLGGYSNRESHSFPSGWNPHHDPSMHNYNWRVPGPAPRFPGGHGYGYFHPGGSHSYTWASDDGSHQYQSQSQQREPATDSEKEEKDKK